MRAFLVFAVLCSSLVACDNESSHLAQEQLRECGLLSDGFLRQSPFYVPDRCYDECLAEASCAELELTLCGGSIDLLIGCDQRCAFTCPDGALVAVEAVCDGVPDCMGGADEIDCPTFSCLDGEQVAQRARCDGIRQCADGSDETDCPGSTCDGGRPLADHVRCDGRQDCVDGTDEAGCAWFTCSNGQQVSWSSRCNGWAQCRDGSDEELCAELTLSCDGG